MIGRVLKHADLAVAIGVVLVVVMMVVPLPALLLDLLSRSTSRSRCDRAARRIYVTRAARVLASFPSLLL